MEYCLTELCELRVAPAGAKKFTPSQFIERASRLQCQDATRFRHARTYVACWSCNWVVHSLTTTSEQSRHNWVLASLRSGCFTSHFFLQRWKSLWPQNQRAVKVNERVLKIARVLQWEGCFVKTAHYGTKRDCQELLFIRERSLETQQ